MGRHGGWSDKKRYEATYIEWLREDFHSVLTLPVRAKDELVAAIHTVGLLGFWVLMVLTLPVSLPIVTYIKRRNTIKTLIERYGKDELSK